jgi:cytochrome c oxidase subunit II
MSRLHATLARTAAAAALLSALFAGHIVSARQAGAPAEPRDIEIVARRFAFEPAEVEVTEGETVRLLVRSGDGLHGFEIKQLKIKKEIPRGAEPVVITLTAGSPGRYPILCSEFCGDGHGDMKGALVIVARTAAPTP